MAEAVGTFLKGQARRALRYLIRETEGLSAEEARQDAHPNWPGQQWGVGQDGSIAGIVYHVAAWKELTRTLFPPGGTSTPLSAFDPDAVPAVDDWPGVQKWLLRAGQAWQSALDALPEEAFSETRNWDEKPISIQDFVFEMIQHDIQHAAQIEYLKQLHLASGGA